MRKPKIAFLDTAWANNEYRKKTGHYGAIAYYRLVKPMQYLKEWFDIDFWGKELQRFKVLQEAYPYLAKEYDLVISKHIDNGDAASNLLATMGYYGRKLIVDLDDDYLHIRKDNPAGKDYDVLKGGRYWLGAFMGLSNGLWVSTDPLKKVYNDYLKQFPTYPERIDVVPNCNDVNDWKFKRRIHNDGKIRIGYMGSITHNDDLELIWEPIGKILQKYPNVKFEIMGAINPKDIPEVAKKIQKHALVRNIIEQIWFYGGTPAWYGFPEELMKKGWDIGIAPLVDEPFNRCKSHIKWFDYTMIGCPTVASEVYPYCETIYGTNTIEHGKTGLFANTTKEWIGNLEDLIKSASYRQKLADNAYNYIKDNWQWPSKIHLWKEAIEKYL